MRRALWIGALAAAVAAVWFWRPRVVHSQPAAGLEETAAALRIRFGVGDAEPSSWEGKLESAGGEVAELRLWHPRPGDQVEGRTGFKLATRRGVNFVKRPWEPPYQEPQRPYLLIPGLIVDVRGGPQTRLRVQTAAGSFEVSPFILAPGREQGYLGGRVRVDRVAGAQLASGEDLDADFATVAADERGDLWTAWVAFQGGRNRVEARRFDGQAWQPVETVSGDHSDIFLVKAARDGSGGVWLVWSAQVDGNWDLYARRRTGAGWGAIERLSEDPQPDIYPVAVTDSAGRPWVAWQGFQKGKSDIFVRRWEQGGWTQPERVSLSAANDWQPALAADGAGRVYVGWDTYEQGHYDVVVRRWEQGRWGEVEAIAATPRLEAYVTLACDAGNRLWAAWNEAGFEWGKDTGFIPKQEGTPLYRARWIRTAVREGAEWKQPATEFEPALPAELQGYNDLPQLQAGPGGRMWLFFRHRFLRIRDLPPDTPAHRAAWEIWGVSYEGERWSDPVAVPFSAGRQDMRSGFATARGALWAAYPTDRRDFEDFLYERAAVHLARMPGAAAPPAAPVLRARDTGKLSTPLSHPNETAELAAIRSQTLTAEGKTYRIYRGDTHRHTEFSMDGNNDGSLLDTYRYALDAASLDFLLVSEHNSAGGPDRAYPNWLLQQMADLFTLPGTFLPFYGYERSLSYPNGHRNVLFTRRGNPTLPIPVEEQKARTGARALYDYLKKYGGIAISHTSASGMGTDWRDNDPEVEPLVEIYQGDRVSNEYEGAPKAAYAANPASAPGGFRPAGYVWNAWAKGYRLGVQASSDHLSTHISYACTLATEFTREALLEAMKRRHSYGATDNIILDYRLEAGARQHLQGEEVTVSGPFRLAIAVTGTKPIRQIDIIKNNRFIHTRHPMEQKVSFQFSDGEPVGRAANGPTYYYVRVQQVDDQMAWSSPIWVNP